jgi:hypothetical protein
MLRISFAVVAGSRYASPSHALHASSQGVACRYSTSPNPPHFNHTSYDLSTEDKFEIMEMCHRYARV